MKNFRWNSYKTAILTSVATLLSVAKFQYRVAKLCLEKHIAVLCDILLLLVLIVDLRASQVSCRGSRDFRKSVSGVICSNALKKLSLYSSYKFHYFNPNSWKKSKINRRKFLSKVYDFLIEVSPIVNTSKWNLPLDSDVFIGKRIESIFVCSFFPLPQSLSYLKLQKTHFSRFQLFILDLFTLS